MELFQAKYFVTLAKYCNFTKAAEQLFITQPTLSQQIKKMERELGFPLFMRNSKGVSLTHAGERILPAAFRAVQEFDALQDKVQGIQNLLAETVVFGTSTISSLLVSGSIPLFLSEFPQVDFKLIENSDPDLMEAVRKREMNLAVVCLPQSPSSKEKFTVIPIQDEYVCAVLAKEHKLAEQESIALEELSGERLVFSSPRSGLRQLMLEVLKENGIVPKVIMELSNTEARLPLILNGAVSFARSHQNVWHNQIDVVLVPIMPYIITTFSIILPADEKPSFVIKSLVSLLSREIKERFERISEKQKKSEHPD